MLASEEPTGSIQSAHVRAISVEMVDKNDAFTKTR